MKKRGKNWLEKFQDFWWDDLTPSQRKCLWSVLTALRGPDKESPNANTIKWATTARIRHFLLGKNVTAAHYGFVITYRQPSIKWETIRNSVGDHFKYHVEAAVERLEPVVKKGKIRDLLEIFQEEQEKK